MFSDLFSGKPTWADNYLQPYHSMKKVGQFCLGLSGNKNVLYDDIINGVKIPDLVKIFIKEHL
jgi:hypothetical protein